MEGLAAVLVRDRGRGMNHYVQNCCTIINITLCMLYSFDLSSFIVYNYKYTSSQFITSLHLPLIWPTLLLPLVIHRLHILDIRKFHMFHLPFTLQEKVLLNKIAIRRPLILVSVILISYNTNVLLNVNELTYILSMCSSDMTVSKKWDCDL